MPTRSSIESWDISHLDKAAELWRRTASEWRSGYETLHRNSYIAGGDAYAGPAAAILQESTANNALMVGNSALDLETAAQRAETGAEDLRYAHSQVLNSVAAAEQQGFAVSETFEVTDTQPSSGLLADAQRQSQAAMHATTIGSRVATLLATDQQVASGIGASGFQMTDYKTSPAPQLPQPVPQPAAGSSPLPFATPRPGAVAGPIPPDAVNDFYKGIAAQEPCVEVNPAPPGPGAWEKLTTPGAGQSSNDLQDAWATYIGSVGGTAWSLMDSPILGGVFGLLTVKPSYDGLMKAYGMAP